MSLKSSRSAVCILVAKDTQDALREVASDEGRNLQEFTGTECPTAILLPDDSVLTFEERTATASVWAAEAKGAVVIGR